MRTKQESAFLWVSAIAMLSVIVFLIAIGLLAVVLLHKHSITSAVFIVSMAIGGIMSPLIARAVHSVQR